MMQKSILPLALLIGACAAPRPGIVSYQPHFPVETQRQISENALRSLLPKMCTKYEFKSPERITCTQAFKESTSRRISYISQSDISCSQIEAIAVLQDNLITPNYLAVLKGDCPGSARMPGGFLNEPRMAGKCTAKIRGTSEAHGSQGQTDYRDFYEALYAYCNSYGYPLQIYGDPVKLFGR